MLGPISAATAGAVVWGCASYLTQIRGLFLRRSKPFLGLLQTPMELRLTSFLNGYRPQTAPHGNQGSMAAAVRRSAYSAIAPYPPNELVCPDDRVYLALKKTIGIGVTR